MYRSLKVIKICANFKKPFSKSRAPDMMDVNEFSFIGWAFSSLFLCSVVHCAGESSIGLWTMLDHNWIAQYFINRHIRDNSFPNKVFVCFSDSGRRTARCAGSERNNFFETINFYLLRICDNGSDWFIFQWCFKRLPSLSMLINGLLIEHSEAFYYKNSGNFKAARKSPCHVCANWPAF